jgi:hypothetical protein
MSCQKEKVMDNVQFNKRSKMMKPYDTFRKVNKAIPLLVAFALLINASTGMARYIPDPYEAEGGTTGESAGNALVNGDFSQDKTGWDDQVSGNPDNPMIPGNCAAGQANIGGDFGDGGVGQCIQVSEHGSDWTLQGEMRLERGGPNASVVLASKFYTTTTCDFFDPIAYTHMVTTQVTATMQVYDTSFAYDTQANNIQSILVYLGASDPDADPWLGGSVYGCFDNISLAAAGGPSNQAPNTPGSPSPADAATGIATNATLSWSGGDPDAGDSVTYTVAFGDVNPPPVVDSSVTITSYNPGTLNASTTYYWVITATDGMSTTAGPLWSFTTASGGTGNQPPTLPTNPTPADGATGVSTAVLLSWTGSTDPDGNPLYYSVAFGTSSPPPIVATNLSTTSYGIPGVLTPTTRYYWNVTATDLVSSSTSATWSFTTTATPSSGLMNGDFSLGTAVWVVRAGIFEVSLDTASRVGQADVSRSASQCAVGQAYIANTFADALVDQCYVIPAHATEWTLAADMGLKSGSTSPAVTVASKFYTSTDCSGDAAYTREMTTAQTTVAPYSTTFSYDTQANGIGSILISMKAEDHDMMLAHSSGCFDNISLAAGQAKRFVYLPLVVRNR